MREFLVLTGGLLNENSAFLEAVMAPHRKRQEQKDALKSKRADKLRGMRGR
jgi:hypothetical protein